MSDTPQMVTPTPEAAEKLRADISAAFAEQNIPKAMDLATVALVEGWRDPLLFNLAAHRLELEHQYIEAARLLEQGLSEYPNDLEMLTALGLCLNKAGHAERALAAFDTVLQALPDFAPAHQGKGAALERMADLEGAERHYRAAVELAPDYVEAVGSLAAVLARSGKGAEARDLAKRALAADPARAGARVALAYCELADGDHAQAAATARSVLSEPGADPEDQVAAAVALGDALNGESRFDDAFAAYADANDRLAKLRAQRAQPGVHETYFDLVGRLTDWFAKAAPDAWKPDRDETEGAEGGHYFIVGSFTRSGGAHLYRTVAAHPDVVALEGGGLVAAEAEFLLPPDGLERLAQLSPAEAKRRRDAYWRRVAEFGGDPKGKLVVEKAPLGAATLCLISALFPKAKVIMALRDPRDAVLTGFRRPFSLNADLHAFMSLAGSARLYDAGMRLFETSWEKLPLEVAEVRQEDLAADPDGETRSLCAFLGVEWNAAMAAVAAQPPTGGRLRNGESQWRNYARQMAEVLPGLKTWVERFGYPEA